jgi:hypothetical protein
MLIKENANLMHSLFICYIVNYLVNQINYLLNLIQRIY